jgi:DNA-binding transcriptional LysR family regulator
MDAHLRDLRYFVAVAEELSFTRAANERLFIAQPTLSRQIRLLETSLRARLFERDHRTVRLTKAGEIMLTRARLLLGQWDEAQSAVAEAAAAADMALRIGFQTRIGRGLIPAVTARMAQLLPGWKLTFRQVSWRDPTAGLASAEVDVAVAWLPVPETGLLSWQVVATEDRWVALPANHRLAGKSAVTLEDLSGEPFIALPDTAGPLRQFWLAADERQGPPRIGAEAETAEESFEAVASGLGVALLAAGNAEIYRRDDVVCRPVIGLSPSQLAVVWRTGDDRKAVQVFTGIFCRCVQDRAGAGSRVPPRGALPNPGHAAVPADLGRRRARPVGLRPPLGNEHHARRHQVEAGERELGELVAVTQLRGQPGRPVGARPGGRPVWVVFPRDVRCDEVAARRQGVDQGRHDLRGLELVGDEMQDGDEHQRDRLAEVQDLLDRRVGQDRLRVTQVSVDVGGAALG